MDNEEEKISTKEDIITFNFPIRYPRGMAQMKNIPSTTLTNLNGLASEHLNTFVFEFNFLCRSYNYFIDAHQLTLFLATLKNAKLHWLMGLGGSSI